MQGEKSEFQANYEGHIAVYAPHRWIRIVFVLLAIIGAASLPYVVVKNVQPSVVVREIRLKATLAAVTGFVSVVITGRGAFELSTIIVRHSHGPSAYRSFLPISVMSINNHSVNCDLYPSNCLRFPLLLQLPADLVLDVSGFSIYGVTLPFETFIDVDAQGTWHFGPFVLLTPLTAEVTVEWTENYIGKWPISY